LVVIGITRCECRSENVAAFLHCDQATRIEKKDWFIVALFMNRCHWLNASFVLQASYAGALAFVGGRAGSFFSAQRCLPWLSLHSQGDSKVTSGAAAAVVQKRATASVNVVRVIACRSHIILSLRCGA